MTQGLNGSDGGDPQEIETPKFSPGAYELLALAVATIGVVGVGNNLLVLLVYYKFKRLRTPTNLFLVNISLSDLLVSVFGLSLTFLSCLRGRWLWGDAGCIWDGFSNSLFGIVSITTLTVLAYERYVRVVHAKVVDFTWAWRAITYIWLYSLAWTGAPLVGWNRYTLEIHGLGCSLDWRSSDPSDASFVLFFFLACLAAPVGVMAYCYGHILYAIHLLRCVQDLHTLQVVRILRYEKKVAKMCFLMISTFLLCWLPYAAVSVMVATGHGDLVTPTAAIVPSFFAKSSTVYNPVIYIFMSRKFRRCLMQLLCFRMLRFQRTLKDRSTIRSDRPIRPIVMSQKVKDKPKKKVTFSSSSIIFIITNDESHHIDENSKNIGPKVNVIQVRPV